MHLLLLIFLSFPFFIQAQTPRETRAVWVSTNFRLDWPPKTYDEATQKNAMIDIFNNIGNKNLNTIYFQVRSNGTVLFRSSLEIFSPYITGDIGKFGNYDPLEFAIKEAHKRGLEIHAWVNTYRVFSGSDISIKNNPLHISQIHPGWVYEKDNNSIWLNPGIPEVREHLVELINEIVQNYDVDGIQLDFIRYPQVPINDSESYKTYSGGKSVDNWRRDNITEFISILNHRIRTTNPKIKLGVTPIGIYKSIPNGRGMEGYSDVFQDTREWLRQGIIDYAVPQIYWDARSNPKFNVLTKDWIDNSFGKNIIIGIGAYKPEVLNEVEREINITRNLKTSGIAFFRYKNIEQKRFFAFEEKALPTEMPWIEKTPKLAELKLSLNFKNNKVNLNFGIDGNSKSKNGYFALYENTSKLIKVVPNYLSEMSFLLSQPNRITYYYSTTQFDQLWNETSNKSNVAKISIPKLKGIANNIAVFNNPVLLQNGKRSVLVLFSNIDEEITPYGNLDKSKDSFLSKHLLKKGFNEIYLNYDLNNYKNAIIDFLNENRSVTL
ncbi:MAG: family 10 glycosylhydrolase [Melioribacteraceae bacterium]|jgi:uncharacterized lipoprotein YddW (UPF0748 family)|nr:family 10 glycosylhydrolase [Melioribacteraceae bacterium]